MAKLLAKIVQAEKSRKWVEGMASLYFFMEFSIPWIWKWLPEVGITLQKIPCIKRKFCSKFWNKLMQIDPETKKYYGQEIINEMEEKLQGYKILAEKEENQAPNPFEHISQRIRNKKGVITKDQMIEEYLNQMKKDLKKNLYGIASPMEISSKDGENKFSCLAGESQDPFEDFTNEELLDNLFQGIRENLKGKSKMAISNPLTKRTNKNSQNQNPKKVVSPES
ncbi:UNVERIFIED_CONTAM: hypothetical protein Slati_0494900 [Sesamum latifolium]|uniref:Uncharacterized protein n=1 Tax=Sesamum latifolium TaxID=2727402 RepID=A0AAW2XXE2_9LAMI